VPLRISLPAPPSGSRRPKRAGQKTLALNTRFWQICRPFIPAPLLAQTQQQHKLWILQKSQHKEHGLQKHQRTTPLRQLRQSFLNFPPHPPTHRRHHTSPYPQTAPHIPLPTDGTTHPLTHRRHHTSPYPQTAPHIPQKTKNRTPILCQKNQRILSPSPHCATIRKRNLVYWCQSDLGTVP